MQFDFQFGRNVIIKFLCPLGKWKQWTSFSLDLYGIHELKTLKQLPVITVFGV